MQFGCQEPAPQSIENPLTRITLIRHGESTGNTREKDPNEVGDHKLELTEKGREQARLAGLQLKDEDIESSLVYTSPYLRTRQTTECALGDRHNSTRVFEDPRLREVDHGYEDIEAQEEIRTIHGWFYYRFKGGESPTDCYDRGVSFIQSAARQAVRKKKTKLIVFSHGITIRCLITGFLHLRPEDYDKMANPANAQIITIAHTSELKNPVFTTGKWGVEGINLR